jgi:hypothetical protein
LGVEPVGRKVELGTHILGGGKKPIGQGTRGNDVVGVNLPENVHILRNGAADETEREQGGTTADDEVMRGMGAQLHQLAEEGERTMEGFGVD